MREIKFRAWDKSNKEMREDIQKSDIFYDMTVLSSSYGVMQFTGLKDKNGKEIYEGDILKYSNWKEGYKGFDGKEMPYHVREVIWDEKEGAWKLKGNETWNIIYDNREVIGNIYENPDLLK